MPNYTNSKIYKIVSDNLPGTSYIGSTTRTLAQRLSKHVCESKANSNSKKGCTSKFIIAAGNHHIIWIEDCPCDNIEQLKARERYYIETSMCVNKSIPGRTQKEWRQANAERLREANKKHRQANAEQIKEQQKQYRQANAERLREAKKKYRQTKAGHM